MLPPFTLRGLARELLSPLADAVVERLGGEPAGTFERITNLSCAVIANTSELVAERDDLARTNAELSASVEQLTQRLANGERAMLDGVAAIDMWRKRAETAEAALADGDIACWGIADAAGHINDAYASKDEAERNLLSSWSTHPLYRHPPKPAGEPVATVGYVVQRRPQGGTWWNYNTLYSDLDGVDRFIKGSLGYWDWDEARILEVVAVRSRMAIAGGKPNAFVEGDWTPLYGAPPPVAIGVEAGAFAMRVTNESGVVCFAWLDASESADVGSRAEVEAALAQAETIGLPAKMVRIVPIDAPVVDLAKVRAIAKAMADVKLGLNDSACNLFGLQLLTAIGESVEA